MPRSVRASLALALLLTGALARAHPAITSADTAPSTEVSDTSSGAAGAPVELASVAVPDRGPPEPLDPAAPSYQTTVEAPAPTASASSGSIREPDLRVRPYATPEDLLRVVPGLVIAQHQGGGKADQLFLRGFDADHGTDVALSIDGIPINLPSHAHGQGYADVHFLIPEAIDRVDVFKGPYWVEFGDFATAGAVNLRTRRTFAESSVAATYGSFQTWRALGVATTGATENSAWVAADVAGTQGPFLTGEDLHRYTVFLKASWQLAPGTRLGVLGSVYGSDWRSSGQIPQRFVDLPGSDPAHLDRFGSIDPTEGGNTQRQMLALTLDSRLSDADELNVTAYAVHYQLDLFNDFTFQLLDKANFDEIEQTDARIYGGLNATYRHRATLGSVRTVTTLGFQIRGDSTTVGLWHAKQRVRLATCAPVGEAPLNPCTLDDVVQWDVAAFLQEDMRFAPWLRVVVGARGDLFRWHVGDRTVEAGIVNPKLQAIITPHTGWELYLDAGGGFHSNDARAVVANNGSGALPRAWGAEVGTRLSLFDRRLELAAALWGIRLQSELVFVADQGTTQASAATDRYGVDLEARLGILSWMWADFDLTLAHAAYTQDQGNGNAVALAPTFTGQAGLNFLHPAGWRGRVGARWVGDRPATQDGRLTAQGYLVVDVTAAYRWRFIEIGLVVENVLNSTWREAQFASTSYVVGRDDPRYAVSGREDVHFTPGNPISVRATLAAYF